MPAPNYRGSSHPYSEAKVPRLIDAHLSGQFVRARCNACRITRYYRPMDIIKIIGDHHVLQIQQRFRCERCGMNGNMDVSFKMVIGEEVRGLTVRELVEIRMVKRPIWRDRKL